MKVAVVTGATDGIGRASAERLGRLGWHVVVVGRSAERCDAVVAGIRAAGGSAEPGVADLARMADVQRLADGIEHPRIDALVLNANAITQERRVTPEGFEANLAIGYLGRALLQWRLGARVGRTLTVVGLDHQRLDLADPQLERGYTAWKALMRWQWAAQVLARESDRRGAPTNVFMPGLVRTKILADEPQPMRLLVRVANLLIGLPPERSAEELVGVVERVEAERLGGGYFHRSTLRPPRDLGTTPADGPALWDWTEAALARWR